MKNNIFSFFFFFVNALVFSQGSITGPTALCEVRSSRTYCYSGTCNCPTSTWQEAFPATGNVSFTNQTGNCVDISYSTTGTFNLEYVIGSGCNCTQGTVISLQVVVAVPTSSRFTTFDYCENSVNKVSYQGTTGVFSFSPNPNDGATIDPNSGVISNGVGGNSYTIKRLEYMSPGCADSSYVTINCLASSNPYCSSYPCNLVTNGSFEQYNSCPTAVSSIRKANDWYHGNSGTSDYWNTICNFTSYATAGINAPIPFPSPDGCIGIYVNNDIINGYYKEAISQKLDLCQGQKYKMSIEYAANASSASSILNDVALFVGNATSLPAPSDPVTYCPLSFVETVTIPTIGAGPNWTSFSTTFTATQNSNSIILGPKCNGPYNTKGYMFFDDFSIVPVDTIILSSYSDNICSGSSFNVNINIPGVCYAPYDVIYTENGVPDTIKGISNNYAFSKTVSQSTTYIFEKVINNFGCETDINEQYDINITSGNTTINSDDFCFGNSNSYTINGIQSGLFSFNPLPNGSGISIDPNTGVISGALEDSIYFIQYIISGSCADTVIDTVKCLPCPTSVSSCNIIANGGFEDFSPCPSALGQIDQANNWNFGTLPSGCSNSTDFYNQCGFTGTTVLNPPQPYPQNSQGCAGFYTNSFPCSGFFKEYLGQENVNICTNKYNVSFDLATLNGYSDIDNDICIWIGNATLPVAPDPQNCPTGFTNIGCISGALVTTNWNNFSFSTNIIGNYNTVIIGPSCGGTNTQRGYVYIDNITITPQDTLTLSNTTLTACINEPFSVNISTPGCYGPYDIAYTKNGIPDTLFQVGNNFLFTDSVAVNTSYEFVGITNSTGCNTDILVPFGITISNQSSTNIQAYDFCTTDNNIITITGNQNGNFSFTNSPLNGESINSSTGLITGAIPNTAYFISYTTTGSCGITILDTIQSLACNDSCELIENGNFELGNIGFTSPDQTLTGLNCFNDGFYNIVNSVASCFGGQWILGSDHTTGSGNFLGVNLNDNNTTNPLPYAYCTNITTVPGEQYSYCLWASNFHFSTNTPTIAFELDGNQLGTIFTVPSGGDWYQHGGIFTATTTNSQLCIKQMVPHNGLPGIDLALDDITVKKLVDSVNISIDTDSLYCSGDSVTIDIDIFGCPIQYSYTVSVNNWDTVLYFIGSKSFTFYVDQPTTVSVVSADCQEDWDTVFNIYSIRDTADFLTSDYCEGQPHIIQNTGTPGGVFSFAPNLNDGATINTSTGKITGGIGGTSYNIRYVTPTFCDTLILPVNVFNISTATISGGGDVCDGVAKQIQIDFTGTPPWSVTYTNGTITNTVNNINSTPYTFSTVDTGVYIITNIENDFCPGTEAGEAIITGKEIDFMVDITNGCSPLEVNFNNLAVLPQNSTCNWSFGDGTSSTLCNNVDKTFTTPGCHDVTLTVSSAYCSATKTIQNIVCVDPKPLIDFYVTPNPLTIFNRVGKFRNTSQGSVSNEWYLDNSLVSTNTNYIHSFPDQIETYEVCLVGINSQGCTDTTCKKLTIKEDASIFVPNAFTPDVNNKNEIFKAETSGIDDFQLLIFNRWGQLIFQTSDKEDGWDGTFNGVECKTDTYVWKIKYSTEESTDKKSIHGHINLLR